MRADSGAGGRRAAALIAVFQIILIWRRHQAAHICLLPGAGEKPSRTAAVNLSALATARPGCGLPRGGCREVHGWEGQEAPSASPEKPEALGIGRLRPARAPQQAWTPRRAPLGTRPVPARRT